MIRLLSCFVSSLVTKSESVDRIVSEMLNPRRIAKAKIFKIQGIKRVKRTEGQE